MSITTELDAWWAEKTEGYDEPNAVKAELQSTVWQLQEGLSRLKVSYDAGKFDNFPDAPKTTAIAIYTALKDVVDQIEASAPAMELLGWTP